jgi:hypothetical protein
VAAAPYRANTDAVNFCKLDGFFHRRRAYKRAKAVIAVHHTDSAAPAELKYRVRIPVFFPGTLQIALYSDYTV